MATNDFSTSFEVEQSPAEVFNAVTNVRGWWSEDIEGNTDKLNDEFNYRYKDAHIARMKLIEVVPDKKVVWQVLSNYFGFTNDKNEWTGDTIIFEITQSDNKTRLRFTQQGLTPAYECYDVCQKAWSNYINNSLRSLITTGKGQPNPKDGGYNEEVLKEINAER